MTSLTCKPYLFIALLFILQSSNAQFSPLNGKSQYQPFQPDKVPFTVSDSLWNVDSLGNHRAIISVTEAKKGAVLATIPWRRPDLRPETKRIVVVDNKTGKKIKNIHVLNLTNEAGVFAFDPPTVPGEYAVYYLPFKFREKWGDARYGKPWNDYLDTTAYSLADKNWLDYVKTSSKSLPAARLVRFESRTEFDFFTPMGLIATRKEEIDLEQKHKKKLFLVFPEDRAYPIRLANRLPWKWISTGPKTSFSGNASPNEYYTWQIGLWASASEINNVKIQFSDFTNQSSLIPKKDITCFNLEGNNWDGKPVSFRVNVKKGNVQALWCGLQIPKDAKPGQYKGTATISADGLPSQTISISIQVDDHYLADQGDNELWRHSRLRWLNSTIGIDDLPVAPYEVMSLSGKSIEASGKRTLLGENGMPETISVYNKEILSKPLTFSVETDGKSIAFQGKELKIKKAADGLIRWSSSYSEGNIDFVCNAQMEYDGYLRYQIKVIPRRSATIQDIRLATSYTAEASPYFMGAGHKGGATPDTYRWDWKGPWDSYWIGGDQSGLHIEFRGGKYHGPLINDYKPEAPQSWANEGKGSLSVRKNNNGMTDVITSSGPKDVQVGDTLTFEFGLLITPVKNVNTQKHFSERYFHGSPGDFEKAAQDEANISNIHHSDPLNPIINYPFLANDSLVKHIEKHHELGRKVKLYYTIRELSNYAVEIFALKSLNHEIFAPGAGYGLPWHTEHLIDDYRPAWYTELPGQNSDAALVLSGFSRWINYYLEGLRWMYENYKIDGIYMDDVSFDRSVMKRMRKISAKYRPEAVVDLHSNTAYSIGPMNQYADFFPYVDRLWFGESFKYNEMSPDEWFVTFSGIPFGQMSEMLQDGGNRYLGMVYGATARHSWEGHSPVPVWKLWKSFGIENAQMIGYWSEDRIVETRHPNVKATAYIKDNRVLISIGNFDQTDLSVKLNIDWQKLKLSPSGYRFSAPEIDNFQKMATFSLEDLIPIKAKEGKLLILEKVRD